MTNMTHVGVLSILEGALYKEVKEFWKIFEEQFDATAVQIFEHPSISFQGGVIQDETLQLLRENFLLFADKLKPFDVSVSELGHSGTNSIFMKVEEDEDIKAVNLLVNTFLNIFCSEVVDEYLPENWSPLITLAVNDLTESSFNRAWAFYGDVKYQYRQQINNIYLVKFEDDGNLTVLEKAKLSFNSED
jgi:hypothetical protein